MRVLLVIKIQTAEKNILAGTGGFGTAVEIFGTPSRSYEHTVDCGSAGRQASKFREAAVAYDRAGRVCGYSGEGGKNVAILRRTGGTAVQVFFLSRMQGARAGERSSYLYGGLERLLAVPRKPL